MLLDSVEQIIIRQPGLTASQIAAELFGLDGYHTRVSGACRELMAIDRVVRRGSGGPADPFTYYPAFGANENEPSLPESI